jgi:hypothetical protein
MGSTLQLQLHCQLRPGLCVFFCYVIPCLSITWIFMGGDLGGHEKGETGLLQSPLDYLYCALSAERSLVAFYVFDFRAEPFA